MKTILRMATTILLGTLLLSCGGGQEEPTAASAERRMTVQSTEGCNDIITIGVGPGTGTIATDSPTPGLPDFITPSVKLYDAGGAERYSYLQTQTIRIHSITENIGDANWAGDRDDMYVMALLSNGYKEDSHSEWRNVGMEQIKRGNIDVGEKKDEYFTVNLATVNNGTALLPGIYNFVVCSDRKEVNDNGDGEVPEKHKSNNCSTEAVFEVMADPGYIPPRPNFTVHSFRFLQAPYYAADPVRFAGSIQNQGTIRPSTGIRSSYSVSCNGGPEQYLTDDGTDADQLEPGESASEENQSLVYLPNTPGSCTARMCADYQNAVTESDETNNCQAITFTLQPRPVANLYIYKFQDENGCCTTNTGDRIKPRSYVHNIGSAAPSYPYPPVIYHISSPVATGGKSECPTPARCALRPAARCPARVGAWAARAHAHGAGRSVPLRPWWPRRLHPAPRPTGRAVRH